MDLSQYWSSTDQQDQIMSALTELNEEGAVDSASDWPALKTDVVTRLKSNGISNPDELVKPLDQAVGSDSEFKSLVTEMIDGYESAQQQQEAPPEEQQVPPEEQQAPPEQQQAPPEQQQEAPSGQDATFIASLPDPEDLATQIITDLGQDLAQLIASDPELAKVSDEELIRWITEDVSATIDEIGEYGWEQLG